MESVRIQTAQHVGIDVEVAGLGDRIAAALIDYALLAAYYAVMQLINLTTVQAVSFAVLSALPAVLYFLLCEVFLNGQSVGKRQRRIKVARLDGTPPALGDYLLRWLLRPVDMTLTMGNAAIVTMLVTGRGQRLGDLAAGTTVIRTQPRTTLRDTLLTDLDPGYTPSFHQVDRLTDEEIATTQEVLKVIKWDGKTSSSFRMGHTLKTTLEHKMNCTSELPPAAFLETVVKDYIYLRGRP